MKQSTNKVVGLVVMSALALGVATAVFAAGSLGVGGYPGYSGMMAGPGMMETPADTAKRLDAVKTELGITQTQDGAWKAYEQAVVNRSALMSAHRETMWNGSAPPPPDQRAAMHQEGFATMQQGLKASQDLYQVLTPQQQAKANTLLPFHPGFGTYR